MSEVKSNENAIKRVLKNEIAQVIAIGGVIYSFISFVIFPIKAIENDIENIKTNHLHTIELDMNELKTKQAASMTKNDEIHEKIMEQLTKTSTVLEEHMKVDKN